ncbi:MAG: 2-hydroxyacid dehydrogenase [Pseudomonadota bacterium]
MKITVFSSKAYDEQYLSAEARDHALTFVGARLDATTAAVAAGNDAVIAFVNDALDEDTLTRLADLGVRLVLLRCAGFNHVDLAAAERLGLAVAHVPAYSPNAVAEHTLALIMALNRKIHRAFNRVREGNFALDGLIGFDMKGRTVGLVGTGAIGAAAAGIFKGFGCTVLAVDPYPSEQLVADGVRYVAFEALLREADIISLHCPLTPSTKHIIDAPAIALTKTDVMLINTSRGALVDTRAVIDALKGGQIGSLGLDVYEEESDLFFEDLSDQVLHDDVFARLLTFPNVIITGHQGFFTHEALSAIARTTMDNADQFARHGTPVHPVTQHMNR